jgi:hypothetical protein
VRAAQLTRLVAAGAIVTGTAACGGNDDADVFGTTDAITAGTETATTSPSPPAPSR